MTISASEAADRYETGVKTFGGASQYQECGEKRGQGFLAVAECLEDAKEAALTTANMVKKYRNAA